MEQFLGGSLLLLRRQLLEDLVANGLSLLLHGKDFVLSLLLLLGVPAHHFVLISIEFLLALKQGALLVLGENHISHRLFLLLLDDASLLVVLLDHALHDSVHLRFLLQILLVCLRSLHIRVIDLPLNRLLVVEELAQLFGIALTFDLVSNLLVPQHSYIDLCIVFLKQEECSVRESACHEWL